MVAFATVYAEKPEDADVHTPPRGGVDSPAEVKKNKGVGIATGVPYCALLNVRLPVCGVVMAGAVLLGLPVFQSTRAAGIDEEPAAESRIEVVSSPYLDRLELRSIAALPGGRLFGLRDPDNDRSFWIEIGDVVYGVEAVEFDSAGNRLTVRYGEAKRVISLSAAGAQVQEPYSGGVADHERSMEELFEMYSERIVVAERWLNAMAESPELREQDERIRHLRSLVRDREEDYQEVFRNLREFTRSGETEWSPEYRQMRSEAEQARRSLTESQRAWGDATGNELRTVMDEHPDFSDEDYWTVRVLYGEGWRQSDAERNPSE